MLGSVLFLCAAAARAPNRRVPPLAPVGRRDPPFAGARRHPRRARAHIQLRNGGPRAPAAGGLSRGHAVGGGDGQQPLLRGRGGRAAAKSKPQGQMFCALKKQQCPVQAPPSPPHATRHPGSAAITHALLHLTLPLPPQTTTPPQVEGEALSLVVPCADMANHSNAPNAAYRLDPRDGCFRLVAARVRLAGAGR